MNSESIQMDFLRCVFFCAPSDLKASQKQAHTGRKDTVCLFFDVFDVAPSGGQICNYGKWCHVVDKFNPRHGVNFWVRCASGNVSTLIVDYDLFVLQPIETNNKYNLCI